MLAVDFSRHLGDRFVLGSRVAGALTRIALDRVKESRGRSLPRTSGQLADPDVVNELIRGYTPPGQTLP